MKENVIVIENGEVVTFTNVKVSNEVTLPVVNSAFDAEGQSQANMEVKYLQVARQVPMLPEFVTVRCLVGKLEVSYNSEEFKPSK